MRRDPEMDDLLDQLTPINRSYLRVPKWLAITVPVCALVLGGACGLGNQASNSSAPGPTVTVTKYATETRNQPTLPAQCAAAFTAMQRMMEANAAIAGAGEEQMDLAHRARQAIFLKDWKMLDKVMNEQVELNNRLGKPNHEALGKYAALKEAMEACEHAVR